MIRFLIATAVTLVLTLPLLASEYVYGGQYWWKGGTAYTRTSSWVKDWYWVKGYYDKYYCYHDGYWAYTWKESYAYTPVKLDYQAADIEQAIIKLAADRDRAVLKIAAQQQKSQSALQLVDKLGLSQNFGIPNYGTGIFSYGTPQLSSAGVQGNSVYGYSYKSVADVYGTTDLNALYQQAARLTENAQTLAGQANSDFSTRVGEANQGARAVAEILARGEAGAKVLQAAKPSPSVRIEQQSGGFQFGTRTNSLLQSSVVGAKLDLKLPGPAKCVSCHSGGGDAVTAWDITRYNPNDSRQRNKVLSRLITEDPEKIMPKGADHPLSPEEQLQFYPQPAVTTKQD